jgi:hypothetical protein
MKKLIGTVATTIASTMVLTTLWASSKEPLWGIPKQVTKDPWFVATLLDAYFGFLTFYGWVYYKESKPEFRLFWFVAIMLGGNAAMSAYLITQLARLPENASFKDLLLREEPKVEPN